MSQDLRVRLEQLPVPLFFLIKFFYFRNFLDRFANLRRFLTYHLTDNVAELAPFFEDARVERYDSSLRVTEVEPVPLEELGRARVDVVMTVSGIFRDLMPLQVKLLTTVSVFVPVSVPVTC